MGNTIWLYYHTFTALATIAHYSYTNNYNAPVLTEVFICEALMLKNLKKWLNQITD